MADRASETSEGSVRVAEGDIIQRVNARDHVHGGYSDGDDHRSVPGDCFLAFIC